VVYTLEYLAGQRPLFRTAKSWFFEQILNIFHFDLIQKRGCDDMHEIETNEKAKNISHK